jgi:hypothetical protein
MCNALSSREVAIRSAHLHQFDEGQRQIDLVVARWPSMRATLEARSAVETVI